MKKQERSENRVSPWIAAGLIAFTAVLVFVISRFRAVEPVSGEGAGTENMPEGFYYEETRAVQEGLLSMYPGAGPGSGPGARIVPEGMDPYEYYKLPLSEFTDNGDGTCEYRGKKYKRNSYMKAILAMGIDRTDTLTEEKVQSKAGMADGLFLIAQDTARNSIKVLMVPRDSILEMDFYNEDGTFRERTSGYITTTFMNGDGKEKSCEATKQAVSELLCGITIDSYMATDLGMLAEVNDAVGGVKVTVPNDELSKKNPEWVKGKEITLHGDDAERFVRYRDTSLDLATSVYRMQQHKAYITGFFNAVKKKQRSDPGIVEKLFDLGSDYLITDMSKDRYMKVALDALTTDFSADDIVVVPGVTAVNEYTEVYIDYEQAIPLILDTFYREIS